MNIQKYNSSNPFYEDIIALFNSKEFLTLKEKYMTNALEADTLFMYLLLMIYIQKNYPTQDPSFSLSLIDKLIRNSKTRGMVVKNIYNIFQNTNENITKLLQ